MTQVRGEGYIIGLDVLPNPSLSPQQKISRGITKGLRNSVPISIPLKLNVGPTYWCNVENYEKLYFNICPAYQCIMYHDRCQIIYYREKKYNNFCFAFRWSSTFYIYTNLVNLVHVINHMLKLFYSDNLKYFIDLLVCILVSLA